MLDEEVKERLRSLTVDLLLEIRSAYLRTSGANVLLHWTQLQDRLRSSARISTSPEEWATAMARSLKLDAPSSRYSESLMALTHEVHDRQCSGAWLSLVESEYGYLMACARAIADQRKAAAQ